MNQVAIRQSLLLWNVALLLVFAAGWAYCEWFAPVEGALRVATLDRAGVIDQAALEKSFPEFADDPRHALGRWIAEKDHKAAVIACITGLMVTAVNLVLLLRWRPVQTAPTESPGLPLVPAAR